MRGGHRILFWGLFLVCHFLSDVASLVASAILAIVGDCSGVSPSLEFSLGTALQEDPKQESLEKVWETIS